MFHELITELVQLLDRLFIRAGPRNLRYPEGKLAEQHDYTRLEGLHNLDMYAD
jgi:hypothetical protein